MKLYKVLFVVLLLLSSEQSFSQMEFPNKPIRLVVPTTSGGNLDFTARSIANGLKANWSQEVIVDNRPGAGTIIGTNIVAKSSPDGYSILITSSSFATNAALHRSLPFNSLTDFSTVILIGNSQLVLVSNINIKTLNELISRAKKKSNFLNYSSTGVGTAMHFSNELLKYFARIDTTHIPFKGSVPALQGLINNDVHYSIAGITSVLPLAKLQKINMLAVTGSKRSQILPHLPTIGETVSGYEYNNWFGVLVPVGTKTSIIRSINQSISSFVNVDANKKLLLTQAIEVQTSSPNDFDQLLKKEINHFTTLSKKIGLTID